MTAQFVVLGDIPIIGPITNAVSGWVGGSVSKAVKTGFRWMIEFLVGALVHAAGVLLEQLGAFFARSSAVSFTDGWWAGPAAQALLLTTGRIALLLMGLFVVLAVIDGIIHADVGAMVRAAFVQVPVSIFGTVTLIAFTTVALEISDGLSAAFLGGPFSGDTFSAAFGNPTAVIKAGLLGPLLVLVFVTGGLLVWVELVIRASLVYLLVMIAPLFLAARIWPAARRSWRRLVELGVAVILAKPVIAIALALGVAAMGSGPTSGPGGEQVGANVSGMLTAATLMLLAVFSPFVILRLIPIVEAAVIAQGIKGAPVRGGMQVAQANYYRRMLSGTAGTGGGGGGGASQPGESPVDGSAAGRAATATTGPSAFAGNSGSSSAGSGVARPAATTGARSSAGGAASAGAAPAGGAAGSGGSAAAGGAAGVGAVLGGPAGAAAGAAVGGVAAAGSKARAAAERTTSALSGGAPAEPGNEDDDV